MKITIEVNGQALDAFTDTTTDFDIRQRVVEIPCDCANPCGYAHWEPTGDWRLSLSADLAEKPLWRDA